MEELKLDKLLSKYVSVWLWSILFGANTGVAYSLISYRYYDKWGQLSIFLMTFLLFCVLFQVFSLLYLYRYFSKFLLIKFIKCEEITDEKEIKYSSFLLNRALYFIILSFIFRALMSLSELLYSFLSSLSGFK